MIWERISGDMGRLDSISLRKDGEGKYLERGNIFLRRIRNKRRKRRKVFVERKFSFIEEMKIREGKGGKLLEKENILCGGHGTETEGSARGPRGPKIE